LLCIPNGGFVGVNGIWRVGLSSPSGYTTDMKKNASFFRWLTASVLLVCLVPLAHAQWSWKDKDGSRVFSDQPPPGSVPEKDILKRPPGARAPAVQTATSEAAASTASSTATTATAPKISGKDSELEKKKKEAEAQEATKKKAEAEKTAAAQKDNCERAKRGKASFDSGQRISTANAQGEREVMSDAARAAESKRLQDIIASDCK
jgi:cytoskeletal protein RodZ